ncbi:tyrosine-type recombinase/integrase [Vibrio barjaei]|uniref:tyrosine-type recombinase/integrase n=1 Tax=Vibrio barjaei TaxID=1676683 RepID=UPI00228361B8|nr:tyrosine-type recombinase/integrase [Vibrio barjaei]MCY9873218.1 tyrosine-type recombinase/integrase [Vibrio barjaei]
MTKLTNKELQALQPKATSYRISCGAGIGLYIVVAKNSKNFQFRYRRISDGKQTFIGLGSFTKGDISLAEARDKANEYRRMLKAGIDPKVAKNKDKLEVKTAHQNTLDAVFEQYFEFKKDDLAPNSVKMLLGTYNNHIKKPLGSVPLADITAPMAIAALKPLERKGQLTTLRSCCGYLNAVVNHAVNAGIVKYNPLSTIGKTFKKPKASNFAAIKPEQIGKLVEFINDGDIPFLANKLIRFQLLTMVRPNEAAKAKWQEIDFDKKLWTIPAERMKSREEHVVPLSEQAIEVLKEVAVINGDRDFVFTSLRVPKTHIWEGTATKILNANGLATGHGLRSLASSTLHAEGFDSMIIEACLSHKDGNAIRAAYNRRDNEKFFERRRRLMDWWGSHVENGGNPEEPEQSNVVNLK